jgi:hypothetical protein
MCPACFATAALIAGSAGSTGVIAALVVNKFRLKNVVDTATRTKSKEHNDGQQHNGTQATEGRAGSGMACGAEGTSGEGERIHPAAG